MFCFLEGGVFGDKDSREGMHVAVEGTVGVKEIPKITQR